MDVYSVNNLMRFLDKSRENGWHIVGTALSPTSVGLEQMALDKPTILVLGNYSSSRLLNQCILFYFYRNGHLKSIISVICFLFQVMRVMEYEQIF